MTTRAAIAAKLDDFSFQKMNFGGFLMNKRAKNSHALWTRTADKGVTELTLLTTRDYGEGNVYDVAAFTLDGTVPVGRRGSTLSAPPPRRDRSVIRGASEGRGIRTARTVCIVAPSRSPTTNVRSMLSKGRAACRASR